MVNMVNMVGMVWASLVNLVLNNEHYCTGIHAIYPIQFINIPSDR